MEPLDTDVCSTCSAPLLSYEKACMYCGTTKTPLKNPLAKFPLKERSLGNKQEAYKEKARTKNERKYEAQQ